MRRNCKLEYMGYTFLTDISQLWLYKPGGVSGNSYFKNPIQLMSPAIPQHKHIGINEYLCTCSALALRESWQFLAHGTSCYGGLWGPQRGELENHYVDLQSSSAAGRVSSLDQHFNESCTGEAQPDDLSGEYVND